MKQNFDLQLAIEANDLHTFRNLFSTRDLESNDYGCGSLLHSAANSGALEIVDFLINAGAAIDRCGGAFDAPAITYAADMGKVEIVRYLVDAGVALDISTSSRNPLARAAAQGHYDVVEYLLSTDIDRHACYRIPTGKLISALVEAEWNGHSRVVQLLKSNGCRFPIDGEDIPLWEPPKHRMVNQIPEFARYQEIIHYMETRFGAADANGMQELLPVVKGMSVTVNVIRPNETHPYLVLFTNGMSDLPMTTPEGHGEWRFAELVMHLPPEWPHPREAEGDPNWLWPLHQLRKLAYYPHVNETWLGLPAAIVSTEDPPASLGPNTDQTCLLALPNIGKLKPRLKTADDRVVNFFTITPLYTEERDYELQNGAEVFLRKLKGEGVGLEFDPSRPNFAASSGR